SGKTLQVVLHALPLDFTGWRDQNFLSLEDRENPLVSAPFAVRGNSSVSNLLRYAYCINLNEDPASKLPRIYLSEAETVVSFVYRNNLTDMAYIVEASDNLTDWGVVIFDSRTDVAAQ